MAEAGSDSNPSNTVKTDLEQDMSAQGTTSAPDQPSAEHNQSFTAPRSEPAMGSAAADDPVLAEFRRHLYDALHDASRDYDQSILTLAAGTLALSVTFAHDITPTPKAGTQTLLLVAWVALVLSLVFIVISFLTSQRTIRLAIREIDVLRPKPTTFKARAVALFDRLVAPLTGFLNLLAGGALITGLALLGAYAFSNV